MQDARASVTDGRSVSFGTGVDSDEDLRLCGIVQGRRVLELGLFGSVPNFVPLSERGARVIVVDPSRENIDRARQAATNLGQVAEFHCADLADLGFLMNSVLDLVLCVHQIDTDTDFARLFRQVHRVLRPEAGFVLAITHPLAAIFDGSDAVARRRYGSASLTIGEVATALQRAGFALDTVHELWHHDHPNAIAPVVLALRARKLGS